MLVGERKIGFLVGAFTVAVSWTWAPALLVSTQKSYEFGLSGFVWFAVPNVIAVLYYYILIKQMRQINEEGYTLPEYVNKKAGKGSHLIYISAIFLIQLYAIVVNTLGSLFILEYLTGIEKVILI